MSEKGIFFLKGVQFPICNKRLKMTLRFGLRVDSIIAETKGRGLSADNVQTVTEESSAPDQHLKQKLKRNNRKI